MKVREARASLSKLLDSAAAGENVIIERHGQKFVLKALPDGEGRRQAYGRFPDIRWTDDAFDTIDDGAD